MKSNNNAKNYNNNKTASTKPVMKTLPIVFTGKDSHGNDYNTDSAVQILNDLQNAGVFTKLSVYTTMAKKVCFGRDDARGVMSVARIQSFDAESGEMSIMFFAKNIEYAKLVDDMVIVPRVRTGRDTDQVSTIFGFEIVHPMEA